MRPDAFAAELLEHGAAGYAAAAAERLLATSADPELTGARMFGRWKQHFGQRILELSAAVGSGEPTLFTARAVWLRRAWDARGFPADEAVRSLRALRESLAEGLPEKAREVPLACLDAALQALEDPPAPEPAELDPARPHDRLTLAYLQDVLEGNVPAAIERVTGAVDRNELSVEQALLDVLMAAQREIGRLWHLDEVTVGEEHLVTSATQRAMAVLAQRSTRRAERGLTAVAAAVAGNPHEVGIRAIAYLLEQDGWRTLFLGNDLPSEELPRVVQFFDVDVILLSCALSVHLRALRQTVENLRALDRPVRIMVGGHVFRDAPDLWRDLGVDGYAPDARAAVALAAQIAEAHR